MTTVKPTLLQWNFRMNVYNIKLQYMRTYAWNETSFITIQCTCIYMYICFSYGDLNKGIFLTMAGSNMLSTHSCFIFFIIHFLHFETVSLTDKLTTIYNNIQYNHICTCTYELITHYTYVIYFLNCMTGDLFTCTCRVFGLNVNTRAVFILDQCHKTITILHAHTRWVWVDII